MVWLGLDNMEQRYISKTKPGYYGRWWRSEAEKTLFFTVGEASSWTWGGIWCAVLGLVDSYTSYTLTGCSRIQT